MRRIIYFALGGLSLIIATAGIVIPLLPTVPFIILAAFFFARSSPRLERYLLEHPSFGPHIRAWRTRGAISSRGKTAAGVAFAASAVAGILLLPWPLSIAPALAAVCGSAWVVSRPSA